jgi:7-keto-8-aminopelargonate synthetase-like enzyme
LRTVAERLEILDGIFTDAAGQGLMLQTPEDAPLDGRTLRLGGRDVISFGSCSYLGLEMDDRLKQGVCEAVQRYGTQFSSSRSYMSAPAYGELEEVLGELFGGPALVAASTSLGHLSVLPVVVDPEDVVVLDQQVHHSVHQGVNLVRAQGTAVEVVRHNRMDLLEERIAELSPRHRCVWYMADGVYSMFADLAPMDELVGMLDRHERFHLYVDDSHGMSWTGRHGRGYVLGQVPIRDRMIVAASLNKAFAAAGGAFVFSDPELRRKIRTCGGTMIFSGPVQPPMLGAALASARIHLSPEIEELQAALRERIQLCNTLIQEHDLPLVAPSEAPIRYVGCGLPRVASAVAKRMLDDGFYVNVAPFPAVPMKKCGIRTPLTLHHTPEDIRGMVEALAEHLPAVLREEGTSIEEVREGFGNSIVPAAKPAAVQAPAPAASSLRLETTGSIDELDTSEWDRLLGDAGTFDARGLRFLEQVFGEGDRPEDRWDFRYYVVRDGEGAPVLATFFTSALWKDDMLAPAAVSRRLERERAKGDRYHMTGRTLAMGSLLTEGDHLWLDRSADWRGALSLLLDAVSAEQQRCEATSIVFRDIATGDEELATFLTEGGLVPVRMPDSHVLELGEDETDEQMLERLSYRARRHVKREALAWEDAYEVEVIGRGGRALGDDEIAHLQSLYRAVHERGLELNVFDLPPHLFRRMLEHDCWEISLLRLKSEHGGPEDGLPVAFGSHFIGREHLAPMVVGLDYRYVDSHRCYRQALLQTIRRARHHGARRLYLGMGAGLEKRRFGAGPQPRSAWVRFEGHYSLEVLASLEADAASAGAASAALKPEAVAPSTGA